MARMSLSADMRRTAIRLFEEGKAADFPLDQVLDQLAYEIGRRRNLARMFLEILLQAAYGDGQLATPEEQVLLRVCRRLGIPEIEFRMLQKMAEAHFRFEQHAGAGEGGARRPQPQGPSLDEAYGLLGLSSSATDAEVKKAYRRLMSQHHPDKLVAKGLPEEMMKVAAQKTHEIRQAYERIKEARDLR